MATTVATVNVGGSEMTAVELLKKRLKRVDELLPEDAGVSAAQLLRIGEFEVNRNPDLLACHPLSILNSVYDAARLGLMLGREAHLVPYKRHCQMIPDYRGFITLVYRSQLVKNIDAKLVFLPDDKFHVEEGTTMAIHHEPSYETNRTLTENITYAYAIAWLRGSEIPLFHVMNRAEIDRIKASSAMKNGEPWRHHKVDAKGKTTQVGWYDRMALKSALKFLTDKRLPLTQIPGMLDLMEIDSRAETGEVSRQLTGETDEELSTKIETETEMRSEELKMKLAEEAAEVEKTKRQREPGEEPEQ